MASPAGDAKNGAERRGDELLHLPLAQATLVRGAAACADSLLDGFLVAEQRQQAPSLARPSSVARTPKPRPRPESDPCRLRRPPGRAGSDAPAPTFYSWSRTRRSTAARMRGTSGATASRGGDDECDGILLGIRRNSTSASPTRRARANPERSGVQVTIFRRASGLPWLARAAEGRKEGAGGG
ncbi:hypothetical protein ACP70R_009530 [Stipagrostis hirtigluma subsp. patula]